MIVTAASAADSFSLFFRCLKGGKVLAIGYRGAPHERHTGVTLFSLIPQKEHSVIIESALNYFVG